MVYIDQMGHSIAMDCLPQRIVSLVPSQTELLFDLGLGDRVVGITKFCIHPAGWFAEKTRVGGTKTLNFEKIKVLAPDLIIGNKEENDRDQISVLQAQYPVWMSDITTLAEALDMISGVGAITGTEEQAALWIRQIEQKFSEVTVPVPKKRVAYIIWRKPLMAAGSATFIDQMLQCAGFDNVFAARDRYPEISEEDLVAAQPDAIFLSSEPYPFAEKHVDYFKNSCPNALVALVDGELFSWYGSRLVKSAPYFNELRRLIQG